MKSGRPSKTAEHNALFRALEARRPDRVVEDQLAEDFLPWRFKLVTIPGRWRGYYENIAAVLRGEAEPMVKLPEMRRLMAVLDAAFASADSGQVVRPVV